MTHKRKEIKKKVQEILISALDGLIAANKIKIQSVAPVQDDTLPEIHIYIKSENIDLYSTAPREINRYAELIIELFARANDGETLDDYLDDIGLIIENALGRGENETLQEVVDDCIILRTDVDADYNGKYPMGGLRMTFQVQTVLPTNTVLETDDLKSVYAKWSISGSTYDDPTDRITLPTI